MVREFRVQKLQMNVDKSIDSIRRGVVRTDYGPVWRVGAEHFSQPGNMSRGSVLEIVPQNVLGTRAKERRRIQRLRPTGPFLNRDDGLDILLL